MDETAPCRSNASVDDEANDDLVFDHLVHHAVPVTGLGAPQLFESSFRSPLLSHETMLTLVGDYSHSQVQAPAD